jgi:hypothetical protein
MQQEKIETVEIDRRRSMVTAKTTKLKPEFL